ncbi:MAG: valine--tRNA ligase [Ktedonobacterales bacterium]
MQSAQQTKHIQEAQQTQTARQSAAQLARRYDPSTVEPQLEAFWREHGIYNFDFDGATDKPIYAVDTPPATVSGHLHLGHVYSYSHADIIARFWRMNGRNVFYPMGFDDNGLPTERLVEKRIGITAAQVGRSAFIERCLAVSEEAEREYRTLWSRFGLSVDWRYSYRTIDERSRRISQWSFLDLHRKGLAYRQQAPAIWCPECQTAIAQAELDDIASKSAFFELAFRLEDGAILPIATTRPELLPACVAVFVHPGDARYTHLVGQQVTTPLGDRVPLLTDPRAEQEKGTGAVMCCTFGDATDVDWWRDHHLPLRTIMARDGRLTEAAGDLAGMPIAEARQRIVADLAARGLLLGQRAIFHSVRAHERCDTPVEYIVTPQWFIRVLDFKDAFLAAGEQITWHPEHMGARYREWVQNLRWDWCISRQRFFGVPIPVWYCDACGATLLPDESQLPLDPTESQPSHPCACGGTGFTPERDVMDTWATSSMTPQIVGRWLADPRLYERVFPFDLRPQAHEIIRTWAFYTIVKSHHHFGAVPWRQVAISGWGLAPAGTRKLSKSRGGGPIAPEAVLTKYSADAARYWAASTGFGKDSIISEDKIQLGAKLITKLWNVAKFGERFLRDYTPPTELPALSPADRWLLSRTLRLIQRVTDLFQGYDYAAAKSEIESFFWRDLADNYLEMAKERLYDAASPLHEGARYTLHRALLTTLQLFAPILPYVTEAIYRGLFAWREEASIHRSRWPIVEAALLDESAEATGEILIALATAVRRYKSEQNLSLGAELVSLHLATTDAVLAERLRASSADLRSVTRARDIAVTDRVDPALRTLLTDGTVTLALQH